MAAPASAGVAPLADTLRAPGPAGHTTAVCDGTGDVRVAAVGGGYPAIPGARPPRRRGPRTGSPISRVCPASPGRRNGQLHRRRVGPRRHRLPVPALRAAGVLPVSRGPAPCPPFRTCPACRVRRAPSWTGLRSGSPDSGPSRAEWRAVRRRAPAGAGPGRRRTEDPPSMDLPNTNTDLSGMDLSGTDPVRNGPEPARHGHVRHGHEPTGTIQLEVPGRAGGPQLTVSPRGRARRSLPWKARRSLPWKARRSALR